MDMFFLMLHVSVGSLCPLLLMFMLCSFKYSKQKMRIIFTVLFLAIIIVNCSIVRVYGREVMMRFFFAVVGIPSIIVIFVLTKDRFSVLIFNFFTAINALYLVSILSHLAAVAVHGPLIIETLLRILLYILIIYLIQHFFSEPYFLLTQISKKGLQTVSLIPFLFFCQVMFMGLYPSIRYDNFLATILLYVVLIFVYTIIYQIFHQFEIIYEVRRQILETQIAALNAQSDAIYQHEERAKILRHDLRHYTQMILGHLQQNQTQEALQILAELTESIEKSKPAIYCENLMVNAILTTYLERASCEGINIHTDISLPAKLNISTIDFSVALANALDNAITSCKKSASSQKELDLTLCYIKNQLILKLSNTCCEKLVFSNKHLPLSSKGEGHGLGTRSIADFVDKYNGLLDYQQKDNMLFMQILIYDKPSPALQESG